MVLNLITYLYRSLKSKQESLTMKRLQSLFIFTIALIISNGCDDRRDNSDTAESKNIDNQVSEIKIKEKNQPKLPPGYKINRDSSDIGVLSIFTEGERLSFISDKELTWAPFNKIYIVNMDTISLGSGFYRVINRQDTVLFGPLGDENNEILEVNLTSSNISLPFNIKIGMSKDDFLEKIDANYPAELRLFNEFGNYDPVGNFSRMYFLFENDTLNYLNYARL